MKEQMEAAIQKAKPLMDESINAIYPQVSCFGSASFGAGGPMAWKDGFEAGWNADKWIPVSERLPEEDGAYVVSFRWKDEGPEYTVTTVAFHTDTGEWFEPEFDECLSGWEVAAWQPLPAPFKG